jgi:tRNA1Val (adenine37-N6)-methyltransferase
MSNSYFNFKQFAINQDKSAFKVGTDGVILGASADIAGVNRILDVGTGTGLIAIMLAQRCNAEITAIEPDPESFTQALSNVGKCRWKDRIRIECTSLQDFSSDEPFDLIVSNPPFFSDSLRNPDPRKSASRHNDSLTGQELLKRAEKLLAENGRICVIMPYVEGNILIAEAGEYGLFCNELLKIRPLATSDVRRLVITFSRQRKRPAEKFLTIEHGKRHEFTEDYISLTKDFYLKL